MAHPHAALHHTLPRLLQQHPGHRLGFRKPIHLNKKHKGGSGKSQKFKMFKDKPAWYGFTTPLQMQVNLTVDIKSLTAEGHRSHGRCCQKFSLLKISPQNERLTDYNMNSNFTTASNLQLPTTLNLELHVELCCMKCLHASFSTNVFALPTNLEELQLSLHSPCHCNDTESVP